VETFFGVPARNLSDWSDSRGESNEHLRCPIGVRDSNDASHGRPVWLQQKTFSMNSIKHRPAHAQDFEASTGSKLRRTGGRSNKFQGFDRNPVVGSSDDLPEALPTLRYKLRPLRAMPEIVSLLLHFLSFAV
jgi:hypothetical protein